MANERESIKLTPKNIAELGGGYVIAKDGYELEEVYRIMPLLSPHSGSIVSVEQSSTYQYDFPKSFSKLIIPAQIFIQQNS